MLQWRGNEGQGLGVGWGGRHLGSLLWEIRLGTGSPELKKKKKDLIEVGAEGSHCFLKVLLCARPAYRPVSSSGQPKQLRSNTIISEIRERWCRETKDIQQRGARAGVHTWV